MRRKKRLTLNLVWQLLVTAVLLVSFALPHHVIPRMKAKAKAAAATPAPLVTSTPEPAPTPTPAAEPEVTETPNLRTEWQKKFADHFTEEIVVTENSYSSPNVSITIEKKEYVNPNGQKSVYFLSDIYVGSIECFSSALLNDELAYYATVPMLEFASQVNAICAINGDFTCYQDFDGYAITFRKGELYRRGDMSTYQVCALFNDGTMETYFPGEYSLDELIERGLWQFWHFGPLLINADGTANSNFSWQDGIAYANPRTAVGYYEPGHYCYVVVDGRQDNYSAGMKLSELAGLMIDLGCKTAYNLDGGGSAQMYYDGQIVNSPSNGTLRPLGDILYVCEPAAKEGGA